MTRGKRWLLTGGTIIGITAVLFVATLYTLQTGWFREKIRLRAISRLEWATGARVDIKSVKLHWRNAAVELGSLVLHGSEPRDAAPLFEANEIMIGLTWSSLLNRTIDLQSVQIERPALHLIIRPDGSTNIPSPEHGRDRALNNLIDLRVHHFVAEKGLLQVNVRQIPLQLSGRDMQIRCRYEPKSAAYQLRFSSKETSTRYSGATPLAMDVNGQVQIEKTRLIVRQLQVETGNSNLAVNGTITNFVKPLADFQYSAHVQAADMAKYIPLEAWHSGEATVTGSLHYDSLAGTTLQANATGRKLSYHAGSVNISGIDVDSELAGTPDRLQFSHFVVSALGASLSGKAELLDRSILNLQATVARLGLNRAASKLLQRSLPWNAFADGRIDLSADFAKPLPQALLRAKLNLQPAPGAPPASGFLDFAYRTPRRSLEFNPSRVSLPGTQLSFSGSPDAVMQVALESTDLNDVRGALSSLHGPGIPALPVLEPNGRAHFNGTVTLQPGPQITGQVALANFRFRDQHWDTLRSHIALSPQTADFTSFTLAGGPSRITGEGHLELANWMPVAAGQIGFKAQFQEIDFAQPAFQISAASTPAWMRLLSGGIASGSVALSGRLSNPAGTAQLRIRNAGLNSVGTNQLQVSAALEPNQIRLTQGRLQSGTALILFSGTYTHPPESWRDGQLSLKIDSNGFPLAGVPEWRRFEPAVDGSAEIHGQGAVHIDSGQIEPITANGILKLRNVTYNGLPAGGLTVDAATNGTILKTKLAGDFLGHSLAGTAEIQLVDGSPMKAEARFSRLDLATLSAVVFPAQSRTLPLDGTASGVITVTGPLLTARSWRSRIQIDEIELRPKLPQWANRNASALLLHNVGPVVMDAAGGIATITNFQIGGNDTALNLAGSFHYVPKPALDVRMNGSVNLQILQLFNPALQSSGRATIAANIRGTMPTPALTGTLDIAEGMFVSPNLPNGLSDVNGRITFNRDRATIQQLKAHTGGGDLSLTGFVGFGSPGPLVYHVQASAGNVRLHYGEGVSVTANADLRLTGSSRSSILSGTATVSRVVFNPNTDIGNLLAGFGSATAPVSSNEFVSGLHLDVAIESAPNLQLSTALSRDVETEINVRLRGTPEHPLLLGNISANQGDIKVFGTKYTINHGEVSFQNTVRIEPVLDLDLETQTRGITVNITISGTVNRLNVAYRSDPPLQPKDIIALLTVGRAPNTSTTVQPAQNPGDITAQATGSVLGQAISSPPSRLSKLFGITNVKIDPMVQGIITNTPQARLTLEQQVSRNLTVTYVTNLSQTSEQIFRVEWALNPQYSLVAVRDENGEFGIDIQYKKRF